MKIGITFGCYAPLHQGHLDLIMRAKKENDMAFVVVCGYDNEARTSAIGLDLNAKTKLIKEYLEDDILKVFSINDTELGIDESMSESNWHIWLQYCMNQINRHFSNTENHITFYVAEEKYKDAIKKERNDFDVVLVDRTLNPISGTLCRENPIKYWNKIAKPFRGLLSHNILIAGTASEGKTTLVRDIAKYFGTAYSYEKGRDNCEWKTDNEFDIKDFLYNLYEQRKYNEELIHSDANNGIFISDTDNMVTLMYADAYCKREKFALSKEDYEVLYNVAKAYVPTTKWNKIFLLAPHQKPIVDDGQRYMPDSDYQIRLQFFEKLKSIYDEFGYKYEILTGDYYSNYLKIKNYIGGLYE